MRSLFEKNLVRMKSELRDLKTAHNRGLGTVKFFRYRISLTVSSSVTWMQYVKADIVSGEPGNPFVQALTRSSTGKYRAFDYDIISGASTVTVVVESWGGPQTVTLDIISSSVLTNLRIDHEEPL